MKPMTRDEFVAKLIAERPTLYVPQTKVMQPITPTPTPKPKP